MVKQKFQSDLDAYKPELNLAQCMRNADAKTGKSYLSQGREIVKLMRKPSLLTAQDYYYFQLYDDSRYGIEHKQRFLSDQAHWGIITQYCDRGWWALADDKHSSYTLLETFGAATPKRLRHGRVVFRVEDGSSPHSHHKGHEDCKATNGKTIAARFAQQIVPKSDRLHCFVESSLVQVGKPALHKRGSPGARS